MFIEGGVVSACDGHISHEREANHESCDCQSRIDGDWVFVERPVSKSVQSVLRKVRESGKTDDGAVDATECSETENLGGVITDSRLEMLWIDVLYGVGG